MAQANGNRLEKYAKWKVAFISSLCAIAASAGVMFVFFVYMRDTDFYSSNGCTVFLKFSVCYVSSVGAWNDSSYLQTITGFYSSIITILIAGLAIVAALGAYTLRAGNKFQIEQDLDDGVSNYFDKASGRELVDKTVSKSLSEQVKKIEIPEQGSLRNLLTALEKRIDDLELQLQEMQE